MGMPELGLCGSTVRTQIGERTLLYTTGRREIFAGT